MPLEISSFPDEVQVAFFMFGLLSDRWEGMSGTYMGKDWASCSHMFDIYEVEDRPVIVYFMKLYEHLIIAQRLQEQEQKRKAADRKQQQTGKTYTHNIQG